jgi:hypothetical protein
MAQTSSKSSTRQRAGRAQIAAYVHSLTARHGVARPRPRADRPERPSPVPGYRPVGVT